MPEFDLLGHPIPENHGKPGANGHVPTAETVNKVRLLVIAGLPRKRIAEELGISQPSLRKHYFQNGKINAKHAEEMARAEHRARMVVLLDQAAQNGNVAAMKKMLDVIDEQAIKALAQDLNKTPKKQDRPLPAGKKDALRARAQASLDADPLLDPNQVH